jgi:hypothetical protein
LQKDTGIPSRRNERKRISSVNMKISEPEDGGQRMEKVYCKS